MMRGAGYIPNASSKVLVDAGRAFNESIRKHGWDGVVGLVVEKGVCNVYLAPESSSRSGPARELCPQDVAGESSLGGLWRGSCL